MTELDLEVEENRGEFVCFLEDIEETNSDMSIPHLAKQEEKIFELKPIPTFVWEESEHQIDHSIYEPKKVLSMTEYKERKAIEMSAKFTAEDFEELRRMTDTAS